MPAKPLASESRSRVRSLLLAGAVALSLVPGPRAAAGDVYVKKDTWAETMVTVRARCIELRSAQALDMGPWHVTRPLKAKGFSDALFPEQGIDLEARDANGKPLWNAREDFCDGSVHNLRATNSRSTYLFRTITAPRADTATASVGSDDGIEIWVNGAKVHSKDVARGIAPDQDRLELHIEEGENRLLMKIHNRTGHHGFYFSLHSDPIHGLWRRIVNDFPTEAGWFVEELAGEAHLGWFRDQATAAPEQDLIASALKELGRAGEAARLEYDALRRGQAPPDDPRWLALYAKTLAPRSQLRAARERLGRVDAEALCRAVRDLAHMFPERYRNGAEHLERAEALVGELPRIREALEQGDLTVAERVEQLLAFQAEALLSNPLLDFDRLLLVKRRADNLGLPQNWQGNCAIPGTGYDNEIAVLAPVRPEGRLTTFFKPEHAAFVGDVDLEFDADRMLFSMPGSHRRWQIWELSIGTEGTTGTAAAAELRQVTPGEHRDVDNYDACYLPDGRIMFASTRCFQGIPCVGGGNTVANLCLMTADGAHIRQLCFDQDHNWCPTVLNSGRVLFSRWEYSDTPHYFSRLLFHMNPDGTNQAEYYGSNSFWPNSIFYARPIPGHATRVVAVVSGHHGVPRMGELVLLDPARGRYEADGVVQRIPGYGKKVEPIIQDQLVDSSWPRFLHPYPLSDKYFLVSCQPSAGALWGIYLVDVFDNMLLLCEVAGYALLEPVPLRKTPRPPVIPDRVRMDQSDATVYLADVYHGNGLRDVPRGAVKRLRVYEYHYTYPQMGGHIHVGVEGPWDVRRILGTVPVYEDGSASFTAPANTPLAVQPLDAEGKALQVMRSWFTAMPGEVLSCVGCHEQQNNTPPSRQTLAARRPPAPIEPWYGPTRGFSFKREVQPALDRYCVGCHNGEPRNDGRRIPNLTARERNGWSNFTRSYLELHPYVRRPGPESDYHLQFPLEWHAGTSELTQMLEKGHHGVKLDEEAWDRLVTWIDLNVPDHGTWGEHRAIPANFHERRLEMRSRYAQRPEDPEAIPEVKRGPIEFVQPEPMHRDVGGPAAAPEVSACDGLPKTLALELGGGVTMGLVLIPAGAFTMGDPDGCVDEVPLTRVAVEQPFYMGQTEVTTTQYRAFDPSHHNGFLDQHHKDHTTPGYPVDGPDHPAMRVSWDNALAFCRWVSEQNGYACTLPTEAQWEWACRAGTSPPLYYGDLDADFAPHANLADASMRLLAVQGVNPQPISNPNRYQDFLPKEARFNDGAKLMAEVGKYAPNPWGLHDMHGNVSEWTLSIYRPYPYNGDDDRNDPAQGGKKVVRGGSWRDRPKRARAAFRLAYHPWQRVFNVGFRVVCPAPDGFSREASDKVCCAAVEPKETGRDEARHD